jgi:hypothetical protein
LLVKIEKRRNNMNSGELNKIIMALLEEEIGEDTNYFMIVMPQNGEPFHFGFGCERCASEILADVSKQYADFPHIRDVDEFIENVDSEEGE